MGRYVEITPNPKVIAADFLAAKARLGSFRIPLEQSVKLVVQPSIQENFFVGGRPEWEPLADETIARRERDGTGEQILVESGRLVRAATSNARWRYTRDSASYLGNSFPPTSRYARFHDAGTEAMPARPFALFQDDDVPKIERVFRRWLDLEVIARMVPRQR